MTRAGWDKASLGIALGGLLIPFLIDFTLIGFDASLSDHPALWGIYGFAALCELVAVAAGVLGRRSLAGNVGVLVGALSVLFIGLFFSQVGAA